MKIDIVDHPPVPLNGHGILPDEQMLMTGKAHHHITRPIADMAGVCMHTHNRRIPEVTRFAVPARMERRRKMQPVLRDFNAGDGDFCRR